MSKIINDKKPDEPKVMPVLYIGGPHDGKRIEMDGLPATVETAYTQKASLVGPNGEDGSATALIKKTTYRREAMRSSAGLYPIYVHHDIPSQDVVWHLLEGYREAPEDTMH